MSVVNGKNDLMSAADIGNGADIADIAEIIGTRYVYGGGVISEDHLFQLVGSEATGEKLPFAGVQPFYLHIKKRCGGDKGLVCVSCRDNKRTDTAPDGGALNQIEHRADTERRAFGRVEGFCAPEKRGGVFLALSDDAAGVIENVRTGDFRDVERLRTEMRHALVTGHVKPYRVFFRIGLNKIAYRRIHACSDLLAASKYMAHSIRLRNSSQPVLYTPLMLPVA